MSDRPTFTVLQGDCEKPDVADLIPDRTTDFLIHTFGALFADIAWQVRRGETASVLNRLNECAEAYGHVPLPADDAAPAAGVVDTRTPDEAAADAADDLHHATWDGKTPPPDGCLLVDLQPEWKRGDRAMWTPGYGGPAEECQVVSVVGATALVESDPFPFGDPHQWAVDTSELIQLPPVPPVCEESVPDGPEDGRGCDDLPVPGTVRCPRHTDPPAPPVSDVTPDTEED